MTLTSLTFLTLSILFISTLTRSTFGFGDALVAMPLLTMIFDVQTATPVVALVGASIGVIIVGRNWHNIDLRAAGRLILASALGVPIGLYFLTTAPEGLVKAVLGVLLILFSLYALTQPALPQLAQQNWAYPFGFISGVFGGAYNINGPPIVIYGTLRRWSPVRFRATLQSYFVPNFTLIALGHGFSGLWTAQVLRLFVLALPVILIAIYLGGKINQRIPTARFEKYLYAALTILGVLLIF